MADSKTTVTRNAFYQTVYNVLATLTPIITTPILTREVGSENIGIFSFTLTVAQYFMVFAMLGVVNYGTRAIAECNGDKKKISKTFWSIYLLQFGVSLTCNILYFLYLAIFPFKNHSIALIQSLWILATLFDINWLFFGIEEFKTTVTRNIIIKLASVIGIVLLVRKENNALFWYTLIMAGSSFLSTIVLMPLLKSRVTFIKPTIEEIKIHLRPVLILFIPLLATLLFSTMDKIMLGGFDEYAELGYYYNADKVINIPLSIINGISAVLFPRISSILSQKDKDSGLKFINHSFEIVMWIAIAMALGIGGISREFIPLFFGPGYDACIPLIYIMVPLLVLNAINIFYRMQYLVPFHKDKRYATALFIGTAVNIVLNAILIPQYKANGAAFATLFSEGVVTLVQISDHQGLELEQWFKTTIVYTCFGLIMFGVIRLCSNLVSNAVLVVLLEILIGASTYILLSLFYWKLTGSLNEKIGLLRKR